MAVKLGVGNLRAVELGFRKLEALKFILELPELPSC